MFSPVLQSASIGYSRDARLDRNSSCRRAPKKSCSNLTLDLSCFCLNDELALNRLAVLRGFVGNNLNHQLGYEAETVSFTQKCASLILFT